MSEKREVQGRRDPVTYMLGEPVDQSEFFGIVRDPQVDHYLYKPGFPLDTLAPGEVLAITGRNPNDRADGKGFFDQTLWLRRTEKGKLVGQFKPIELDAPTNGYREPEEFTIGAIHSSIDSHDRVSESGPQRVKTGYFLQGENLAFPDGSTVAQVAMAGRIVCYELLTSDAAHAI